jgi:hypothetical protein
MSIPLMKAKHYSSNYIGYIEQLKLLLNEPNSIIKKSGRPGNRFR